MLAALLGDLPGAENFDLRKKSQLYAEAGIAEYWIVDANASCIHVCRTPHGSEYADRAIAQPGDKISPFAAPDAMLDLSDLFT